MRLVTYVEGDLLTPTRAGALVDGGHAVLDLQRAYEAVHGTGIAALSSVGNLIDAGEPALALARSLVSRVPAAAVLARDAVRLLAPLQPPPQMRDCSCFELHLRQSFAASRLARAARQAEPASQAADARLEQRALATFRRQPIYYKCNRFAVIGADQDVIWPAFSSLLDFELEFGCYIGTRAKDVDKRDAARHIVGYTIFNDISARDAQAQEMGGMLGPAKSKDFDTANVMGPSLVTADEIEDPYDLTMIARVNGEEWGRGSTRDMHWRFDDVIAHISRSETLYPGEFLGSGTVGNGCGLESMRYLQPGDVVELEVEQLGVLRTRIVKPAPAQADAAGPAHAAS